MRKVAKSIKDWEDSEEAARSTCRSGGDAIRNSIRCDDVHDTGDAKQDKGATKDNSPEGLAADHIWGDLKANRILKSWNIGWDIVDCYCRRKSAATPGYQLPVSTSEVEIRDMISRSHGASTTSEYGEPCDDAVCVR